MKTFWKKKLPACLLALALLAGTVPMASAASADLTYDVDEDSGDHEQIMNFSPFGKKDSGPAASWKTKLSPEIHRRPGIFRFFTGFSLQTNVPPI